LTYRRSFTLSRELDASKIEANLKDGVLKLRIPKAEEARPRRIEIKVG
jgi:HSP20 family protein